MTYHGAMKDEPKRLQKVLAERGVASRRKAEVLILEGRVKVNGVVAKIGVSVVDKDDIVVDGKPVKNKEKLLYLAFNKPRGYVVSTNIQGEEKIIFELIKTPVRVFPIGRLDKESEGLLLLTNDGDLAQKVSHPSYKTEKVYEVTLDRPVKKSDTNLMEKGIPLHDEDGTTYTTSGVLLYFTQNPKKVKVRISIGKNHVIRKMFGHFGYAVQKLKRVSVGVVTLGSLKSGESRPLSPEEINELRASLPEKA